VDNELEVIRDQMEQKRASLSNKLDALEGRVLDTVHEVSNTVSNTVRDVSETVDTVTEGIQETVEAVKESLNVSEKIRQHPWIAMGGGFVSGFVGALLLGSSSQKRGYSQPTSRRYETNGTSHESVQQAPEKQPRVSEPSSGLTSQLGNVASEAMNTLKGMAVGTLMGVLSEVVADVVPASLKEEVDKLFGELNTQLGGKALYKLGLTDSQPNSPETSKGESNVYGDPTEVARSMGPAQGQGQEPVGQFDRRRADPSPGGLRKNDRAARGANGKKA